ncbi:hypothetical protein CRE_30554 [Caenorhabditis remanei]|uniref:F-box domain-containing protein n=1 Tax=Caenorhabditis remanei TaxID=31234 RepID=E3NMR0_CAERE|nr:hypothetical protein CRE_30554 [Caenorhabditis remanei]
MLVVVSPRNAGTPPISDPLFTHLITPYRFSSFHPHLSLPMLPFPLLRLPRLVLCEVFKSLSIGEKIKLSFCSKKISTQIHIARLYSQKVIVDLDILSRKIEVHSENSREIFHIFNCSDTGTNIAPDWQPYRIEGRTVPVIFFLNSIQIFWKNNEEGFLSVTQHLLKMFQCKISIKITGLYQPIIFELFKFQLEFKALTIRPNGSKNQILLWNQIFSKLELVEDLIILHIVGSDVTPVFASWPQTIIIWSSAWFTLEYLLACPCTSILLEGSHFENKDLEVILRKWKTGGFPNLEYLCVYSQGITNNGTTIMGMNFMELNGKVIQTDDGSKKATIIIGSFSNSHRIEMFETPFE